MNKHILFLFLSFLFSCAATAQILKEDTIRLFQDQNNEWVYKNASGETLSAHNLASPLFYYEELAVCPDVVELIDNKNKPYYTLRLGYVNGDKNIIIPCRFTDAKNFREGLAAAAIDGKYGFIDKKGNAITPFIYDDTQDFFEGMASVGKGADKATGARNKYGVIDKTGKEVIPLIYDWIGWYDDGKFKVQDTNGKIFFIDKTGKRVE